MKPLYWREGLTSEQAALRLSSFGYNEIAPAKKTGLWALLVTVVTEPMVFLLLVCALLYIFLGDLSEGLMLAASILLIIGIAVYQEYNTEKTLTALRNLASPRAWVWRDGQKKQIDSREVVVGDVLFLSEGDRIAADGRILEQVNLMVDEATLTGESLPVSKSLWQGQAAAKPGGDLAPWVFAGTLIIKGQATVLVTAIGLDTQIGQIGKGLAILQPEKTGIEKETKAIVRIIAVVAISFSIVVLIGYLWSGHNFVASLLPALSLAMGILPEEIPVVLAVFMALGAWRLSHKKVLARRGLMIEALGSADVLCVDKTGTLTQNKMTVACLSLGDDLLTLHKRLKKTPAKFHHLIEAAVLASSDDPYEPMELAMRELARKNGVAKDLEAGLWLLQKEYPLENDLLAMTRVWHHQHSRQVMISAKGSPEAIISLCHLQGAEAKKAEAQFQALADQGYRVIGVARAKAEFRLLPAKQHDFTFELLGFLGFADPIRPEVPAAIEECALAGISVKMITGDYPATALRIAQQIGLDTKAGCLTGEQIDQLNLAELEQRVPVVNVFARIVPAQKMKIIQALKANGHIVAMTGDGVNDAPALKAAHIGIAMGKRGTDVAREAAGLVLLDDNFASIVAGIRQGRQIYDNLRKAIGYLLAVHLPILGLAVVPVLGDWPLALLPIHIVLLELIIDPTCSIAFEREREELNIMKRPPRPMQEKLLNARVTALSLLYGLLGMFIVLFVYRWALAWWPEAAARQAVFVALLAVNLALLLVARSDRQTLWRLLKNPNPSLLLVAVFIIVVLAVITNWPAAQHVMAFADINGAGAPIFLGTMILMIAGSEVAKAFFKLLANK
jgi:Ca2+-transporting ATPase